MQAAGIVFLGIAIFLLDIYWTRKEMRGN